jgi:hypothetical protein
MQNIQVFHYVCCLELEIVSDILLDWVTVKTQLLNSSISYLFIAFVGFTAFIAVLVQTTCFGPYFGPFSGLACV